MKKWMPIGLMIVGVVFVISGIDLMSAQVTTPAIGQVVIGAALFLWGLQRMPSAGSSAQRGSLLWRARGVDQCWRS